ELLSSLARGARLLCLFAASLLNESACLFSNGADPLLRPLPCGEAPSTTTLHDLVHRFLAPRLDVPDAGAQLSQLVAVLAAMLRRNLSQETPSLPLGFFDRERHRRSPLATTPPGEE